MDWGWTAQWAVLLAICLAPSLVHRDALGVLVSAGLVALCGALPVLLRDALAASLALGPLAMYLLLLGSINLSRRPFPVSGSRDTAALGLAVAGLVLVGPLELFFPTVASIRMGFWVWPLLAALYGLIVVLLLLSFRQQLVIYNVTLTELRPVLAEIANRLDDDVRWAGDSLFLPRLALQLHIETMPLLRNVSLVCAGADPNALGWRQFESAISAELSRMEVPRNLRAVSLVFAGLILIVYVIATVSGDPQAVARAIERMLQA